MSFSSSIEEFDWISCLAQYDELASCHQTKPVTKSNMMNFASSANKQLDLLGRSFKYYESKSNNIFSKAKDANKHI